MYIGNLTQLDFTFSLSPKLREIILDVKERIRFPLPIGKYVITEDDVFFMVVDDSTQLLESRRSEIHRDYIDVQILLEGEEVFGYSTQQFEGVEEDLLDDKDVAFSEKVINEQFVKVSSNEFVVFYPGQPHRPLVAVDAKPASVKKVIVKIHKDFL
ncbi:YhcH/YjgK/YiaL family protein [Vibrio sp. dhg]|uniref:YhcH/YjgK/YiaL family protein n=1 Tax=Vibrio sp. dhg TaxID=2163016 RepID=UPI000E4F24EE|nr:YhcH/YjgK/YiaL family protein [Vibrio sp. dhg]AXT72982.1 YhcH/YjgK/YiaL family protein [Vibrio sp. dhg]